MADEFFDDEQELMEQAVRAEAPRPAAADEAAFDAALRSAAEDPPHAPADVPGRAAGQSGAPVAAKEGRRTPPPFWMVLVIAAIALLLGIVIGYLAGSAATLSALSSSQAQASAEPTEAADSSAYELPEGHPDLEVDADGTAHVADGDDAADAGGEAASDSTAADAQ